MKTVQIVNWRAITKLVAQPVNTYLASLLVCSFIISVSAQDSVCVPNDYSIVTYGSCASAGATRMKTLVTPQHKSCIAPDNSLVLATKATCQCAVEEITPVLTECIGNRQNITSYVPNSNSNCSAEWLLDTLPVGAIDCICTSSDIGYTFTDCDRETGLYMTAVSYWKRSCTYFEGLSPVLPDMRGATAPCDIHCNPGEVLRAPNAFCVNCSAGSMSNLGTTYRQPYRSLPLSATSSCASLVSPSTGPSPCSSWTPCPDGSCLFSGYNWGLDNIESDLVFHLTIRSPDAFLEFSYMTDIEKDGDLFVVYVGDSIAAWQTGYNDWSDVVVPLFDPTVTPPAALCEWSVMGICIEESQLSPYDPKYFFNADYESSATFTDGFFVVSENPCHAEAYANATLASIVLANISSSSCPIEDVLSAAIQSGTVSVLLFSSDLFSSANGHLTGDSRRLPPSPRTVVFGVIAEDSMNSLLSQNYSDWGSSGSSGSSSSLASSSSSWGSSLSSFSSSGGSSFSSLSSSSFSGSGSSLSSSSSSSAAGSSTFDLNVTVHRNPSPYLNVLVTLAYVKDGSISTGSDRISVRDIVVSGTSTFAMSCDLCPPGFFSDDGATACSPCPKNTFSNMSGSASCTPCADGYASAQGSASCVAFPPCALEHFVATHGPCFFDSKSNADMRVLVMSLASPPTCNPSLPTSLPVPPPTLIPCGSCDVGSYRDPSTHRCKLCPAGQIASSSPPYCSSCPAGFIAKRELFFSTFDILNNSLPANWSWNCDACVSSGFHFSTTSSGTSAISVGPFGVPFGTTAGISILENFVADGTFSFNYTFSFQGNGTAYPNPETVVFAKVQIQTLDGTTSTVYNVRTPSLPLSGVLQVFPSVPIPQGDRVIQISFTKSVAYDVQFTINALRLTNARSGGSRRCSVCPAGYTCPFGVEAPQQCLPGSAAVAGTSSTCTSCSGQKFSQFFGQDRCNTCSSGTVPIAGGRGCGPHSCLISTSFSVQPSLPLNFNLSAFSSFEIASDEPNTRARSHLRFALCSAAASSSCSGVTDPTGSLTYGCVSYNSATVAIGANFEVNLIADSAGAQLGQPDGPHLEVTFDGGPCYLNTSMPLKTIIALRCDATGDPSRLVSSQRFTSLTCVNDVEIVSPYACPVCDNSSFVSLTSPCDGETTTTTYFYRSFSFGGASTPTTTTYPTCIGMPLPPPVVASCRGTVTIDLGSFGAAHIIFIVVVIVVGALAGTVYCLVRSRREVFNKYQALQSVELTHAREMSVVSPPPPGSSREVQDDFSNIVNPDKIKIDLKE